jgi:hypothetical protein
VLESCRVFRNLVIPSGVACHAEALRVGREESLTVTQ